MALKKSGKNESLSASVDSSQPIPRMFRVMECMAERRVPTRLIDLANALGMSQSTVYRYVRTLCQMDYACCDESTGNYALTWKICRISSHLKTNLSLRSIASPYLNSLASEFSTSACLVVMDGIRTSYIDFVDNPDGRISSLIRIGHTAPIHSAGSGKILLSAMPKTEASKIIDTVGLVALTPKTITKPDDLFAELDRIRRQGYAIDDEECEIGHRCLSVPLYDYTGNVIAAISLSDITENMSFDRMKKEILPTLRKASEEISYRLGYSQE